jgi:hypothetical protein
MTEKCNRTNRYVAPKRRKVRIDWAKGKIYDWENFTRCDARPFDDGCSVSIAFTQDDGEKLIAVFLRGRWVSPPVNSCGPPKLRTSEDTWADGDIGLRRRTARIVEWGDNHESVVISYRQADGQKVTAVFERWRWIKAPAYLQAEMNERIRKAFKGGTIATAGPRR